MNREVLDKWCERGILGLVLAILVFAPLATGSVRTLEFLIVQGMTVAVMILWAVRLWINPRPQLLWPPISWVVLLFVGYAVARYLAADLEYIARLEMVRVLVYAFLFLAIVNNLHRQEHMRFIVLTLVFLAMCIAGYAVYQFATGSQKVWHFTTTYVKRGTGTFISPNNLGGFLEMILPLGLAWALVSRAKHVTKIFVGYASLVILAGIAVSVSRGAWFSTAIVLLVFFGLLIANRRYRLPALVLLILGIGAAVYFVPRAQFFQKRLDHLTQSGEVRDGRFDLWQPAVAMWRENIWFGIGPNHFNYRYREYRPPRQQFDPDRVHNDYLNALVDWGIVGAAILAGGLVLLGWGVIRTWGMVQRGNSGLGEAQSNKFALVLGSSMGLLAILLHSFTDFNLHVPSNAILALTLAAMLTSSQRFATDNFWMSVRPAARVALTLFLLAGLGYFGWQGTQRSREYVHLAEAARLRRLKPIPVIELRAALERAFAAEPANFKTAYDIAEAYRIESWDGSQGYERAGNQAIEWYQRAARLNPYHGYSYLFHGACLDWLERVEESGPLFDRGLELDPNGYTTAAWVGCITFRPENTRRRGSIWSDPSDWSGGTTRLPIRICRW